MIKVIWVLFLLYYNKKEKGRYTTNFQSLSMKTNDRKQIKNIVLKYLKGTHSARELALLHEWIMDERNKHRLDQLIDELLEDQHLSYARKIENEEARIWNRIYTKLNPPAYTNRPSLNQAEAHKKIPRVFQLRRIAATIALLVSVGITLWFFVKNETTTETLKDTLISWNEKKTNAGEKVTISLPDGSKVKLNSLSGLRYSGNFNLLERKIFLVGEAYFEVEKNDQKPFIVVTGNIETSVLGTSFNVKSFSDSVASIAVTSGHVLVKDRDGNHTIALKKDEMANIHANNPIWHKSDFDYEKVIGWKDGILVFENEGFEGIMNRLESWYGVEFKVVGKANSDILINTTYHNDPLSRILHGLSFTYNFDFEINEKQVVIRFKS